MPRRLCLSVLSMALLGLVIACANPLAQSDPEKEQFIKLVQQNAEDPSRLEIVHWGERKDNARAVRFRCAKVGVTPAGQFVPFAPPARGGDPVMLEDAAIQYKGDTIVSVYLSHTYQVWYPK